MVSEARDEGVQAINATAAIAAVRILSGIASRVLSLASEMPRASPLISQESASDLRPGCGDLASSPYATATTTRFEIEVPTAFRAKYQRPARLERGGIRAAAGSIASNRTHRLPGGSYENDYEDFIADRDCRCRGPRSAIHRQSGRADHRKDSVRFHRRRHASARRR